MLLLNLQQNPLSFIFLLSFTIWTWWTLDGVVSEPQLSYVKSGCSSYNVSDVAIFNKNLNASMRSLRAQVSNQSKHSAVAQAVKGNNPAYGVFQCRNYLSIKDCLGCFDFAAVHIYDNCSVSATGARVIYEGCFLRRMGPDCREFSPLLSISLPSHRRMSPLYRHTRHSRLPNAVSSTAAHPPAFSAISFLL
ncbi:plasmodesmata-located protein 7-like [Neltuma alba]|uniref:plasmodesmata-located protein 7-like n=1 Tax=Neltuma alba TaxID=207710 RepID=UPI0010A2BE1E|nr:plasmodesmata-located protein 7-like [Prosopis alba]